MRKIVFLLGICLLVMQMISCDEDSATKKRAAERARLKRYITEQGYDLIYSYPADSLWEKAPEAMRDDVHDSIWNNTFYKSSSELHLHELERGKGKRVVWNQSTVSIKYIMYNLEGDTLEDRTVGYPVTFTANNTAAITRGVLEAVSFMKEGGVMRSLIPSKLFYDAQEKVISYDEEGKPLLKISPYETIIYDIYLVDVD